MELFLLIATSVLATAFVGLLAAPQRTAWGRTLPVRAWTYSIIAAGLGFSVIMVTALVTDNLWWGVPMLLFGVAYLVAFRGWMDATAFVRNWGASEDSVKYPYAKAIAVLNSEVQRLRPSTSSWDRTLSLGYEQSVELLAARQQQLERTGAQK